MAAAVSRLGLIKQALSRSPTPAPREAQLPLSLHGPWATETTSTQYAQMNDYYREYRRDSLTRACIDMIAWVTTSKGFETRLEPVGEMSEAELEKFAALKEKVDAVNKLVNMDWILQVASIKKRIYGKTGFEIVPDQKGEIVQLLPLRSEELEPKVSPEWELKGFRYKGKDAYTPDEVLYLTNNPLEADYQGLSDIEPILTTIKTRRALMDAIEKTSRLLWAPIGKHTVDVSGLDTNAAKKALEELKKAIKPGKHIITSQKIESDIWNLTPSRDILSGLLKEMNDEIMGHFCVPKLLFARTESINRATAEIMMTGFFESVIAKEQRYLKREVERQFYDLIVRKELKLKSDDKLPVVIKHVWNEIKVEDFHQMAATIALLFESMVIDKEKAWDLMRWELPEGEKGEK